MGLWSRIKRSVRALFGGVIERTEDPELILQQTIRDMRDRIPDLNNSVAQVMATEKLLAKNKERLETQVVDLDSKIKHLFPITEFKELNSLRYYNQILHDYYDFIKIPENYFDLPKPKPSLPLTYHELDWQVRNLFLIDLANSHLSLKEIVQKLKELYKFQ